MGDREQVLVRVESNIGSIDEEAWDRCANPDPEKYNPFISHAFLKSLEDSECVSAETGWYPQHLVLDDGEGDVLGCVPCYLKSHSQGEYVFDHGWAEAFHAAGGQYYPKLQAAVPFTPVTGRRLLIPDCPDCVERQSLLASASIQLTERLKASSFHMTFSTEEEWALLGRLGFLQRTDQQFHWANEDYGTFDDFLSSLTSRKRKTLKKERRDALANDIGIEWITGSDITEFHWDVFFDFYMDTGARKWGTPYLNREFLKLAGQRLGDHILLIMCTRGDRYIAGALNFIGGDTLYGRYWGCSEDHRFLHFETCYYQAIDYAIAHGLKSVEAGAQGMHKLMRGYLPKTTYSVHFIADPGLRRAVGDYLSRERFFVEQENQVLTAQSPFRSGGGPAKNDKT